MPSFPGIHCYVYKFRIEVTLFFTDYLNFFCLFLANDNCIGSLLVYVENSWRLPLWEKKCKFKLYLNYAFIGLTFEMPMICFAFPLYKNVSSPQDKHILMLFATKMCDK